MGRSFLRFSAWAITLFGSTISAHASTMPKPAWVAQLHAPVYNVPQAANGMLYLTSMQGTGANVFALDAKTGKTIWSFDTKGAVAIPPTVGAAQLFVASDADDVHYMRALNAQTGALVWEYTRNQPPECMCSYPSTLADGLLMAQTDGHSLFAFQPQGGVPSRRVWSFAGNGALLTNPVMTDGVVVAGSADRNVYGLDAKTGKILWQQTTGYAFTADPVVADGVVIIGDQGGNMDGFALKTGKILWSTTANGAIDNKAVIAGTTAFLASEDHNIYALNIQNGQVIWQYTMDDYASFPLTIAGDEVVVDNRAGQLMALDARHGARLWQTDLQGTPFSAPLLWPAHHAVVLKVNDHEVSAYNLESGKALWQYQTKAVVTVPVISAGDVAVATSQGAVLAFH